MKKTLILIANLLIINQLCFSQSVTIVPTNPANPTKGTMDYNNATNQLQYWNNAAWIPITNAASGTGWALSGNHISNNNTGNVGIGTTTPQAFFNIAKGKTAIFGSDSTEEGSKLVWFGSLGAFRVGHLYPELYLNIGKYSTALGDGSIASGLGSFATGYFSEATNTYSTAMGNNSRAASPYSMAFGTGNIALGLSSTAMGVCASTNSHKNSFCISGIGNENSQPTTLNTTDNQMMMRFDNYTFYVAGTNNYAYITTGTNGWAYTSDRNRKENFEELNGESVLKKISKIPFYSWNFKDKTVKQYRHYGIMAQDFYQNFGKDNHGVIGNDTTVSTLDLLGVAYSGIKALEKRTEDLQVQNEEFRIMNEKLEAQNQMQNQKFSKEIAELKAMIEPKRRKIALN